MEWRDSFFALINSSFHSIRLRGFYECGLCPLQEKDELEYLNRRGIDTKSFFRQIRGKKLMDQIKTPFFLIQIADLYLLDANLPPLNELMNKLVEKSFKKDTDKYVTTRNIQEQRSEMINAMQRAAFAMQCMKKVFLEDMEYQELLRKEDRERLKYCGIWEKTAFW